MKQEEKEQIEKLEQEIKDRETLKEKIIEQHNQSIEEFDLHTAKLKEQLSDRVHPQSRATELWCRITNVLIAKYKTMSEQEPERAVKELLRIEGALLAGGFITEEELENGL